MLSTLSFLANARMGIRRRQCFGLILVMLLTMLGPLAAPAPADPAQRIRESISLMREVLAPYKTEAEMNVLIGVPPTRRIEVPGGVVISVWPLSKKEAGWWPLAEVLNTGDRLNLICKFPTKGGPRSEDSCGVHRSRSNRAYYRNLINPRQKKIKPRRSGSRQVREALMTSAQQLLAEARTAFEVSILVGEGPHFCRAGYASSLCSWRLNSHSYGHGTLAMTIEANFTKKIDLTCLLPADGTPRAADSCDVYISDGAPLQSPPSPSQRTGS